MWCLFVLLVMPVVFTSNTSCSWCMGCTIGVMSTCPFVAGVWCVALDNRLIACRLDVLHLLAVDALSINWLPHSSSSSFRTFRNFEPITQQTQVRAMVRKKLDRQWLLQSSVFSRLLQRVLPSRPNHPINIRLTSSSFSIPLPYILAHDLRRCKLISTDARMYHAIRRKTKQRIERVRDDRAARRCQCIYTPHRA